MFMPLLALCGGGSGSGGVCIVPPPHPAVSKLALLKPCMYVINVVPVLVPVHYRNINIKIICVSSLGFSCVNGFCGLEL